MIQEKRMDTNFRKRLHRRLYYGDMADLDTPSLPLTETAVSYFRDTVPEKLGQIDLSSASRAIRRNRVSPCSVVLSMLYAKRLRQRNQSDKELLQTMSSSDVFFISMMMASKYLYDEGVDEEVFNDEWADNTDQDVDDVNQMEMDFLQALDWKLFVWPHEFEATLNGIEKRLALQEGLKRGWFTYSEMDVLMDADLVWTMWTQVGFECSKLVTAISAAYLTTLLSMVGSAALAMHISGPLSSATIALFGLHSPSLLIGLSAELTSPDQFTHPTSWISDQMPSAFEDEMEQNRSMFEEGAAVLNSMLDSTLDDITPDDGGGSHLDDDKLQSGRFNKSSLWSLWFLDSFLSQLWAVTSRFKVNQFDRWSSDDWLKCLLNQSPLKESGKSDVSASGTSSVSNPLNSQKRHKNWRHGYHGLPYHDSEVANSLASSSGSHINCHSGMCETNPRKPVSVSSTTRHCICPCFLSKSLEAVHLLQMLPSKSACLKCYSHCWGTPSESLIECSCDCVSNVPGQWKPFNHCCKESATSDKELSPYKSHFEFGPRNGGSPEDTLRALFPTLQAHHELLQVPVGFVTSFYPVVRATEYIK